MNLHSLFQRKTVRVLYLIVSVIVIINTTRSIYSIWKKRGILDERKQELAGLQLEKRELEKKYEYVQSDEYVEYEAREKLGLGKEGETVVLIEKSEVSPKEQAGKSPDVRAGRQEAGETGREEKSNLEMWVELFW